MACISGTNIVNDGLVFHFDLENGVKSWRGKPTSNIISGEPIIGGMQSIVPTFVGIENGWKKFSISGTWNAGTYPFSMRINGAIFTGGVAYSSRCLLKTNVREKYLSFGGLNYVNDPNMQSGGVASTTSLGFDDDGLEIIESKREGFIYSTGYANPTTSQVGYLNSRPISNGTVFNPDTDFVWIKEIQVEEGDFCTKYVGGIRLDTASIVDVSPFKSTITAVNLTYRQDDTPTFDGTDDYVVTDRIPGTGTSASSVSWCIWTKPDGNSGNIMSMSSANPQTSWNMPPIAASGGKFRGKIWPNSYLFSETYTQGNWYYVCLVYNYSATIGERFQRLYINGEQVAEQTGITYGASGSNNFLFFGQANPGADNTGYYAGEIEKAQVYNKALTAQEIKQNFEATRSRYGI